MNSPLGASAGVGFTLPPGDPGLLADAGARFSQIAEGFDGHGATILATGVSLTPSWTGLGAAAYQNLSADIGTHFSAAAGTTRSISATLGEYSSELDRCQREGTVAMSEAERCLEQINTQSDRVTAARSAAASAQGTLSTAQATGATARAAGPVGVVAAAAADAEAAVAQTALAVANEAEQAATRLLAQAEEELARWQARGRGAQQEAEAAARRASGNLQGLTLVPPPLAGLLGFPPLSPTPPGSLIVHDEPANGDKGDQPSEGGSGDEKQTTPGEDPDRNPKQDKELTPGEIKKLKKAGVDPEELKGYEPHTDLFKDRKGNIYVKPKGGAGPGDPTGVNINNPERPSWMMKSPHA